MDTEIKQSLVRALRLGGYHQTREFLKRKEKYCVLGLLCELYRLQHGGSWEGPFEGKNGQQGYCFLLENGEWSIELPSPTILAWAGMSYELAKKLYHLNDIERQTFAGIANYLEAT